MATVGERWVAGRIPDAIWMQDGHVLIGPMLRTIREILIEALTPVDDDFRIRQGDVVLYDGKLNMGWYNGETQTWFPETQTGTQGNGSTYPRKVRLSGAAIITAGGNHRDPIQVDLADTHGNGARKARWKSTVYYLDDRERVYHAGKSETFTSSGVAALWAWDGWPGARATNINPNPPGADYYPMGEFPIDAALPLPWDIDIPTTFLQIYSAPYGLYGAVDFGTLPYGAEIWSWWIEPVGIDDDLVLNGETILPTGYAEVLEGGENVKLATYAPGTDLSVDIWNTGGPAGGSGKLRVVPVR